MGDEWDAGGRANRPRRLTPSLLVAGALGLVALGAGSAVLVMRTGWLGQPLQVSPVAPVSAPPAPVTTASDSVEVVLTPEAIARAGIKTAAVTSADETQAITVPGTVLANAYREVKVTPIAGGIVTRVAVELGSTVKRGQPLAAVFSSELADAQTKFLSMAAMLEADHRKLRRTQELVEIGAASRQELEEVTAVHATHETELESARQRLMVLGLGPAHIRALQSPSQIVSTVAVPAPIDGVVTARSANLGQVIGMGQEMFVVTDLSEVWAVGDLYEQDFAAVRVGSAATVSTPAYPGLTLQGRVTYIDPRVEPATRTAKVRVEVPNRDGRLRLGMYLSMAFDTSSGQRVLLVPKAAVQSLGDRQVVFLPAKGEAGKFIQRIVRLGEQRGESQVVLSGLQPGELVVTEGSFLLRAEAARNAPSG
jgi:membrane fusion protein, heavy metal efflux system